MVYLIWMSAVKDPFSRASSSEPFSPRGAKALDDKRQHTWLWASFSRSLQEHLNLCICGSLPDSTWAFCSSSLAVDSSPRLPNDEFGDRTAKAGSGVPEPP